MFEPEVFRKQMYCIEESTCDIVETFRRTGNCVPLTPLVAPLHLAKFLPKYCALQKLIVYHHKTVFCYEPHNPAQESLMVHYPGSFSFVISQTYKKC